ncbi:MAG TPA: SOS response-associated peptidase [Anaerolineae bacterium]|nr:SOS response-associated peptidase [Anaerolineae bacterium]
MCGRFTLTDPDADLAEQFNLPEVPDVQPRYNIAPTQPVAAVRLNTRNGQREMVMLRWGLIPSWAQDPEIGARMINARAETAAEKPAFRAAFRRRRCLVVADGFYEWQKQDGVKQPMYIHLRDHKPFGFAGLWEFWKDAEGKAIETCTLLTTEPNDLIRTFHNRMPVILPPEYYESWLNPEIEDPDVLQPMLTAYPAEEMEAYPISRWVNNPDNEGPRCVEPLLA